MAREYPALFQLRHPGRALPRASRQDTRREWREECARRDRRELYRCDDFLLCALSGKYLAAPWCHRPSYACRAIPNRALLGRAGGESFRDCVYHRKNHSIFTSCLENTSLLQWSWPLSRYSSGRFGARYPRERKPFRLRNAWRRRRRPLGALPYRRSRNCSAMGICNFFYNSLHTAGIFLSTTRGEIFS